MKLDFKVRDNALILFKAKIFEKLCLKPILSKESKAKPFYRELSLTLFSLLQNGQKTIEYFAKMLTNVLQMEIIYKNTVFPF
jgi:hypothetical protein